MRSHSRLIPVFQLINQNRERAGRARIVTWVSLWLFVNMEGTDPRGRSQQLSSLHHKLLLLPAPHYTPFFLVTLAFS
jgi:hypothetical protein